MRPQRAAAVAREPRGGQGRHPQSRRGVPGEGCLPRADPARLASPVNVRPYKASRGLPRPRRQPTPPRAMKCDDALAVVAFHAASVSSLSLSALSLSRHSLSLSLGTLSLSLSLSALSLSLSALSLSLGTRLKSPESMGTLPAQSVSRHPSEPWGRHPSKCWSSPHGEAHPANPVRRPHASLPSPLAP